MTGEQKGSRKLFGNAGPLQTRLDRAFSALN